MTLTFSVNWDYRCPFARIVNEHVVAGLKGGADWNVKFLPFSLTQVHCAEDELPSWQDPAKTRELRAVQVGIVVQHMFPREFYAFHVGLFSMRHDHGNDLRRDEVLSEAMSKVGIDPAAVFAELEKGWPLEEFRSLHEESVKKFSTFGVPTIFVDDKAAFVRLLERASDDHTKSQAIIERVVDQIKNHSEINELKHTTIPY